MGIVDEGNQNVRAEAGGRSARGVISVNDGRCLRLQRVEFMHPSGRLGMLICEDVCNLRVRVSRDSGGNGQRGGQRSWAVGVSAASLAGIGSKHFAVQGSSRQTRVTRQSHSDTVTVTQGYPEK